jgi:SagB-type dehydrogenase family enzyme
MVEEKRGKDRAVDGIGVRFQEETKYTPENIGGYSLDWAEMPETYKSYGHPLGIIPLPQPEVPVSADLWETILKRRSVRTFARERPLPLGLLAALLWATQGITARGMGTYLRSTPSAGGLYPIETYVVARAVEGLEAGIYHFRPHKFDVELIKRGDFAWALAQAALGQEMIAEAQATFVWTAVAARGMWKYRQRAYRYIYMDAGHIAGNLYLAGTALGLGVCAVGAFFDDRVNGLLDLDGVEETALYMGIAGWPAAEQP